MYSLNRLIVKYLKELIARFESDTTEVSESQAIDILRVIAHEAVSKEQACSFLNLSRSRFDELVREGRIPKGKKVVGYKELRWYKDELELCKNWK
jgi:predicted DNA-binding transcriptional regulator AlpA